MQAYLESVTRAEAKRDCADAKLIVTAVEELIAPAGRK